MYFCQRTYVMSYENPKIVGHQCPALTILRLIELLIELRENHASLVNSAKLPPVCKQIVLYPSVHQHWH